MERLKHSKIYPYSRKCFVGLLIAVVVAFSLVPCTSANSPLQTYSNTAEMNVRNSVITVSGFGRDQNVTNHRDVYIKFNIDFAYVPHYSADGNKYGSDYSLIYATKPTSVVCLGKAERYQKAYDYTCRNGVKLRFTFSNFTDYRFYNDNDNNGYVRSGWQLSVMCMNTVEEMANFDTIDAAENVTFEVYGANVELAFWCNMPQSTVGSYAEGYADGQRDTIISGLSEEQTAFGIIGAVLNSVANLVQQFVVGLYENPIGAVILSVGGLALVAGVVVMVVKFFA